MNRRHALMTLLAISLVAGQFLFIVPSVSAMKPGVDLVIIQIDGNPISPEGDPWNLRPWTDYFDIEIVDIPFNPEWKQVGDIYDVTVKADIGEPGQPGYIPYKSAINEYLDNNEDENAGLVEILLLLHNKYLKWSDELIIVQFAQFCDFDGNGIVDSRDKKLVANANNQPDLYSWAYDLNQDGLVTDDDVRIANSFIGTSAMWMELSMAEIPEDRIVEVEGYKYLITDLWHFSGWGIRR